MKNPHTTLIVFFCILASCDQKTSEAKKIKDTKISRDTSEVRSADSGSKNTAQIDNLGDFGLLTPIEVLDPKSLNVYEKYGIEFDGNCYTCDLAIMRINKKHFDIVNVCDKDDFYRNETFVYEVHPNELRIKTDKNEFIFTKIETAPVYELRIVGDKISLKKKRISKFYTQEKELKKFKQHDCGEFDG